MQSHLDGLNIQLVLVAFSLVIAFPTMECSQPSQSDDTSKITNVTKNPFSDIAYKSIFPDDGKQGWPTPYLWKKAPKIVVEKWLTEKPETQGKYVILDFWATWCAPCLRMIPKLNYLQKTFGDKLVIIGISEEVEDDVSKLRAPKLEYPVAIDTQKRLMKKYIVGGLPYGVIIEPGGYVVYQGYGLNEEIVKMVLDVGSKSK